MGSVYLCWRHGHCLEVRVKREGDGVVYRTKIFLYLGSMKRDGTLSKGTGMLL